MSAFPHRSSAPPTIPALVSVAPRSELSRRDARLLSLTVAAVHVAGLWALLQVDSVRTAMREVAPLMIDLIAPAEPQPAPPPPEVPTPPPPAPALTKARVAPQPSVLAAPHSSTPAPESFSVPTPTPASQAPTDAEPAAPIASPSPSPPAAATPAPSPPPRKLVPATALRYRIEPPFEVPRASRRAGEFGIVQLRVVVSALGEPVQVRVLRSSGYARLDEQAVAAMRQARLHPYTEDGRPIEIEAIATADYPQE